MFREPRAYRGTDDLQAMRALLQAGRLADNGAYYVHPGDLNWWLFYPPFDYDPFQYLYLVDDPASPGEILAWILLSPDGFNAFDVFVQPRLRASELESYWREWAELRLTQAVRLRGENLIRAMWVRQGDPVVTDWLESHGFHQGGADAHMLYDLDRSLPEALIPPGCQLRASAGLPEVHARASAQHGAFGSKVPFDRYVQRFTRFMQSGVYDPQWDIVAEMPDGKIGAFCLTWPDPVTGVALFEPVGTHPDYQRKGLGRAVMLEALRRLARAGMRQAIVTTGEDNLPAIKLYESVGFRLAQRLMIFKKEIEA